MTYLHNTAVAFDMWGAALLVNRDDVTISSLAGKVRRMDRGDKSARDLILLELALRNWQIAVLRKIARGLEYFWPGHCENAIKNDIERATRVLGILR